MGITISQKEISLDLQNQGFTNTIYSQQGDTDSRKLVVSLFDDGEEYIISSSSTVYLEGTRADDAVVHRKVDSVLDNMVTILFKNEELCVKGIAKYKISIYGNDGSILSSVPFKIKVYENIYNDEGIIATPEYSELQKILEDVSELEDNINKSEASRVESENKRNESESLRTESEEARKTAENQRSTAEEIRISSENERVENEKNRTKEFAEMKKSADGAENLNIESISSDENYQVKITNRNGEQNTSPNLLNKLQIGTVESGEYDENASATITGKFGEQKLNLRLPIGKPFKISKTYSSIDVMNQNISADLNLYEFCMIDTGNVEDEDTAKLYMRDVDGAHYITDLSGVQGIQGVKGETGETPQLTIGSVTTGNPGTNASVTITGTKENPVINFVIPRGATGKIENVSADSIGYSSPTDTKTIKDVIDEKLGKSENAVSATKATNDKNGNDIATTYVKSLTVEGRVITYTKGDGTTNTITTQDTVYTHPTSDGNKHVPANGTTNGGKYLKATSTAGSYEWDSLTISNVDGLQSALDGKAASSHSHTKSQITDFPTSLPANGGNSDTVNGHTVESDVPVNAKFTDTVYDDSSLSSKVTQNTNDISELKTTDNVLSSRIDAFTSLTQGSTTGDAELQDIRVKADGTIAENAGNAVREQISELKSDFGNLRFSITENNLLHVERKE